MCHGNMPGSVFNRWMVGRVWNELCEMDAFCLTLNCPARRVMDLLLAENTWTESPVKWFYFYKFCF